MIVLKKLTKKSLALLSVLVLLLTTVVFFIAKTSAATWESEYDQRKKEVESKISDINSQLGEIGDTVGELANQKQSLKEQIAQIESEIETTNKLITETKLAVSEVEWQIEQNENKISALKDQMKLVFRALQRQNDTNTLELILSSDNLGEAISKMHNLSSYEVEINNLKKETESLVEELNENRETLKETEDSLESAKALNKSKEDQLRILLEETEGEEAKYQALLLTLSNEQKNLKIEATKISAEKEAEAKRRAEIEEKRRKCQQGGGVYNESSDVCTYPSNGGSSAGGTSGGNSGSCVNETVNYTGIPDDAFVEPVYGYITQEFGCVNWGNGAHDGVDIANALGTQIKSIAAGKVVYSGWKGGYGYVAIIKHTFGDRRIYSVYGHQKSQPIVAYGANVSQGQVIGYLGSTGYSTGPHLHFAIADESYELTGNANCNPRYGATYTYCFNPFGGPFKLW